MSTRRSYRDALTGNRITRMTTRNVRYHFRQKFPGNEITRKCVRAARLKLKPDDPHGMDNLIELLKSYQLQGGVGNVTRSEF